MSEESPRFVPLDLGRYVSAVFLEVEDRLKKKRHESEDWAMPISEILDNNIVISDIARNFDGALAGHCDCSAVFHVTCGLERGLHGALIGSGSPKLESPYMLCERHTRAATLQIINFAGIELPKSIREHFFSASITDPLPLTDAATRNASAREKASLLALSIPPAQIVGQKQKRIDDVPLDSGTLLIRYFPPPKLLVEEIQDALLSSLSSKLSSDSYVIALEPLLSNNIMRVQVSNILSLSLSLSSP